MKYYPVRRDYLVILVHQPLFSEASDSSFENEEVIDMDEEDAKSISESTILSDTSSYTMGTSRSTHERESIHDLIENTSMPPIPAVDRSADERSENVRFSTERKDLGLFSDVILSIFCHELATGYLWDYSPNPKLDRQVRNPKTGFCSVKDGALKIKSFRPNNSISFYIPALKVEKDDYDASY